MALSIKSDEADILAREVASLTGESLTEAVTEALRLRLRALASRQRENAAHGHRSRGSHAATPRHPH
jgi:antitoxin VapB